MSQDAGQGRYAGRALAGGRYQLRYLLGEGGMASVHLAYDSVLDRQVAIKTLHTELGREQAFRERFRREAQAVAKLTHTNIVSVFDTGEDDLGGMTTPYIVMEYVEGRPLGSVLDEDVRQQGAMPADKALKITADVLAALEISHEMGLVHRDIKPGNVMMTKRGVVKVMDFGIARAMQSGVTSMTQTGMVVGTPQYLSPEQALGRGVDARSDPVLGRHHALPTGHRAPAVRRGLAAGHRVRASCRRSRGLASSVNRALPPAVDALVARALKKNPNERFPQRRGDAGRVPARGGLLRGGPAEHRARRARVERREASAPRCSRRSTRAGPVPTGPVQDAVPADTGPGPEPAYGTPAPAPHSPAYGCPQQGGYPTPAAYFPQGPSTPPPYQPHAVGAGVRLPGGRESNKPVIIGSIVVALVAVGGLVGALTMNNGGGDDPKGGGETSASASASKAAGYRGPDKTKTIEKDECTEPEESYNDPDKIKVPDFSFKYIGSVKERFNAAGWRMKVVEVDENTYGEGSVRDQFPAPGTDVDPEDMPEIQLKVSTGNPPS